MFTKLDEIENDNLHSIQDAKILLHHVSTSSIVNNNSDNNTSTISQAVYNFVNSIVGAGIIGTVYSFPILARIADRLLLAIGLPFAIHQCGFVVGVLSIVVVAAMSYNSVLVLIKCGIQANITNFEGGVHKSIMN